MFKLGEYYEGETKPIVNYLKDARIKVEQKISLCAITDSSDFLEGRLSELRGEMKDIETYERYLEALKAALAKGATPDDLRDRFYCELDPVWAEKKRQAGGDEKSQSHTVKAHQDIYSLCSSFLLQS